MQIAGPLSCHDTPLDAGVLDAVVKGVWAGSDRQVITTCQVDTYFGISVAHDAQLRVRSINVCISARNFYWNPLDMEGLSDEHISSTSIDGCAADWDSCAFQCSGAGKLRCEL